MIIFQTFQSFENFQNIFQTIPGSVRTLYKRQISILNTRYISVGVCYLHLYCGDRHRNASVKKAQNATQHVSQYGRMNGDCVVTEQLMITFQTLQ